MHLENNTFDNVADTLGFGHTESAGGDGDRDGRRASRFAAGDEARVIVVGIKDVRIADWKGAVSDWVIAAPQDQGEGGATVNGLR